MKSAKILVIISLIITFLAIASSAVLYLKQKESADQVVKLNSELERVQFNLDSTNSALIDKIKEITTYVSDSVEIKGETLIQTKNLELRGLIQNIYSPIAKKRTTSTQTLITNWSQDEGLVPDLIDFADDRFGQESYNMSGIINSIVVLNSVGTEELKQNRQIVSTFISKVERLKNREQTQKHLETLKNKMIVNPAPLVLDDYKIGFYFYPEQRHIAEELMNYLESVDFKGKMQLYEKGESFFKSVNPPSGFEVRYESKTELESSKELQQLLMSFKPDYKFTRITVGNITPGFISVFIPYYTENGDFDEDGVLDKFDKCPKIKGPVANGGCPYSPDDWDGDGIKDDKDDCPKERGSGANKGCPK